MLSDDDKQWMGQAIDQRFEAMTERMELMETRLLTEFHRWAQTYEIRARGTTRAVHDFEDRLGLIEERVAILERGKPQ